MGSECVTIGNATLYRGDCLDILREQHAPALCSAALVTDPPYNVGYRYASHDDQMPEEEYLNWLAARFAAAAAAGVQQALWLWPGRRLGLGQVPRVLPSGWALHHVCAAYKREFAGDQWLGQHPAYAWQPIIWAARLGAAAYGGPKGGHGGRDCLLSNHSRHDDSGNLHPCPTALPVARGIVNWVRAEVILDPFAGSGTIGVAALQAGRRFVGIETDRTYFVECCRRITDAQRQLRLL